MNVECAVWDVERDVERGAGDDCCAHPPIVNITITKQIQLNSTHTHTITNTIHIHIPTLLIHK